MTRRLAASLLAFSILIVSALTANAEVKRLSEPVAVTDDAEIFGAPLNPDARSASLAELLDNPDDYIDTAVRVDARISQVCQMKGCFMIATVGDRAVRISFRDYGFFVPTDTGGKTVTLTGTLIERTLSEDDAAHYRKDAGSDVIEAGTVYEIVADAVSIPRA